MEDKNLVAEMIEELDDTGRFLFGLLALMLLEPKLLEELEEKQKNTNE